MIPFRFLHAADLHLERTLEGVSGLPPALEERWLDLSYRAAERLFEAALTEQIDFLLLSGDVINPLRSGPRGPVFLVERFEALRDAGIDVYWAGGEFDSPEDWPTFFPLPENVRIFPSSGIQEYLALRGETPIARILGTSRNQRNRRLHTAGFTRDAAEIFSIVVANGIVDPVALSDRHIPYWALGGQDRRQSFYGNRSGYGLAPKSETASPTAPGVQERERRAEGQAEKTGQNDKTEKKRPTPYIVHYPGPLVARNPGHEGLCGATLVEVVPGEEPALTLIPTAPLRWVDETIRLEPDDDTEAFAAKLRQRIKGFREEQLGQQGREGLGTTRDFDMIVRWKVEGASGGLNHRLRHTSLAGDLLTELRGVYGKEEDRTPLLWSLSLEPARDDDVHAGQYEQKTILGDYLRLARHHRNHPEEVIDLTPLVPEELRDDPVVDSLLLWSHDEEGRNIQTPEQKTMQTDALRDASVLGCQLLGGVHRGPEP